MTAVQHVFAREAAASSRGSVRLSPVISRSLLLLIICAAVAAAALVGDATTRTAAVQAAGEDLTRLMRFMAAIKGMLALAALAALLWRLGVPVAVTRFLTYGATAAAMGAGPVLIWTMVHVGLGALLLHGGLLASVLLLWNDPAVADRLARMLPSRAARRRRATPLPRRARFDRAEVSQAGPGPLP